jgi:hypothetical protein
LILFYMWAGDWLGEEGEEGEEEEGVEEQD